MKYFLIIIAMLNFELSAQDNQFLANKRNILPGSRAALLGGAYTALSNDATGIFYNPAGMVFGPQDDISISANAYFEKTVVYKGALKGRNFKERSTGLFPSFIGGNFNFRNISLGWALITLESQTHNQNEKFSDLSSEPSEVNYLNITHQQSSDYNLVGLGGSFMITPQFSFGLSVFGYRRSIQASNHQMVGFNDGSLLVLDSKIDTENSGIKGILGSQWRGKNYSFGISYCSYYPINNSSHSTIDSMTADIGSTNPMQNTISGETSFFDELSPNSTQVGYAFLSRYLLLSFEVIYYEALKGSNPNQEDLNAGFDYGIGSEIKLFSLLLRGSYFSNYSLFKKLQVGQTDQAHHIDFQGYSFGFAIPNGNTESNIGVIIQNGTGQGQKVASNTEIQEVESRSLLVVIGSNYEF